jgi:hypothetical protein
VTGAEHLVLVDVPTVGQDRGDARAQPLPLHERAVADEHPADVTERIQVAGREAADGVAQVT